MAMDSSKLRDSIDNSFLELLKEKNYETIKVNEIAQKAFVSRATFYEYYNNKEEILTSLLEEFLIEFDSIQKENTTFLNQIDMMQQEEIKAILYPNTTKILEYFFMKRELISAFNSTNVHFDFMRILQRTYFDHFITALPNLFYQRIDEGMLEYYALFMTNGVTSIVERWFHKEFKTSLDTVSKTIINILSSNLHQLFLEIND